MVIRILEPIQGNPKIKVTCKPKADYGKADFKSFRGSNHVQFKHADEEMRLTTNIPISHFFDQDKSNFILTEKKYMILSYGSPFEAALEKTAEDFLLRTKQYRRHWVKKASIPNYYQSLIIRSALVLKLHQYEDTGAIIAASTTSYQNPRLGKKLGLPLLLGSR